MAMEAKMRMEGANVTLVFNLSLHRDGPFTIEPPFTPAEMLTF